MSFAEDQRPVGDLSPGGEHEPFRTSIPRGLLGRIFAASMSASVRTLSNEAVNCPAQHQVVDQQDVRRVSDDPLALRRSLLTRVALECHQRPAREADTQELLQWAQSYMATGCQILQRALSFLVTQTRH